MLRIPLEQASMPHCEHPREVMYVALIQSHPKVAMKASQRLTMQLAAQVMTLMASLIHWHVLTWTRLSAGSRAAFLTLTNVCYSE